MAEKPKVAVVSVGGTICSIGKHPFDLIDYDQNNRCLDTDGLLARLPEAAEIATIIPVRFRSILSSAVTFAILQELIVCLQQTIVDHPDLDGIVIAHGTATLEETAYFLNLTLRLLVPVVLVGSQRPANALSSDAGMNLANAIRVAGCRDARGLGVLVLLNDEIQAARDVRKSSTFRLNAFHSADWGALGHADADKIAFYRRPLRRAMPETEFIVDRHTELPRVDISISYLGSDGAAIPALVAAGAKGIVSAGFLPWGNTEGETYELKRAVEQGVVVVCSARAASGRVPRSAATRSHGFIAADDLTPQKARILLSLALTRTTSADEIQRFFEIY